MSDVAVAENVAPKETPPMAEATAPARRPHRATRPAAAPAAPTEHLPPKRGYIRLLCVQDYIHGHRIQVPRKVAEELEDYADLDPRDIKAAQTRYKAGQEYYLLASEAARLLRDKGPSRFRNPLTERIERRKEADVYFRAVDREELEAYLDRELDKIEERREAIGETDVNDQNVPEDEDDD